jgi:cytochrome b involved in lipid metabolism
MRAGGVLRCLRQLAAHPQQAWASAYPLPCAAQAAAQQPWQAGGPPVTHPLARLVSCGRGAARQAADAAHEQQQDTASAPARSSSAAEPATSFIANPAAAAAASGGALTELSMRQVAKHATDDSCWIVVNGKVGRGVCAWVFGCRLAVGWCSLPATRCCAGERQQPHNAAQTAAPHPTAPHHTANQRAHQVYDVTRYIDDHPGGADSILQNAGVDCTDEFMGVHSQVAARVVGSCARAAACCGPVLPPSAASPGHARAQRHARSHSHTLARTQPNVHTHRKPRSCSRSL